jgi:hypothetical protein
MAVHLPLGPEAIELTTIINVGFSQYSESCKWSSNYGTFSGYGFGSILYDQRTFINLEKKILGRFELFILLKK